MEAIEKELNNYYGESKTIAGTKIWTDDTTMVSIVGDGIVAFEDIKVVQAELLE